MYSMCYCVCGCHMYCIRPDIRIPCQALGSNKFWDQNIFLTSFFLSFCALYLPTCHEVTLSLGQLTDGIVIVHSGLN